MRKILKIIGIVLGSIIGIIVISITALFLYLDHEMPIEHRPIGEYTSPDGKHVCYVHVSDGGVTIPSTVVAQVEGKGILGKRTIYVVERIDEASVIWVDDRTVWINGVALDIYQDKYVSEIDSLYGP
jgi:hypothetical protein